MLSPNLRHLARRAAAEAGTFVRCDHEATAPLPGAELRQRQRRIVWARRLVQGGFLLAVLWIGISFARWVHGLEQGVLVGSRPPGVEGFLPIAALLSLRHLAETGLVHPVHPAGLVILLLVIGVSFIARKAFCSWACPVGAICEAVDSASVRLFRRRLSLPRWLDLPLRSLKYLLLAFFLWVVLFQMDGRAVADFLDSPYNRVADVKMLYFFQRLSTTGAVVLGGLGLLSLLVPYFWCRYLCPYGGLLGAVSLFSPLGVTRHAASCIDCGLCTRACPSRLPVARLARVRSSECVGCLSCVAACPVPRALRVETPAPWPYVVRPAFFAALVIGILGGGILLARAVGPWHNAITDAEYAERIRAIDGPAYAHERGRVPSREEWEAWERTERP